MQQFRINWIDWAKAIAIFAVVLGHTSRPTDPAWTVEAARIGRIFHVPLFFLVSGYLFRVKDNNFGIFVMQSAKSLVIPYVFFNLTSAAILWKLQSPDVYEKGLYGFLLVKGFAFAGPAWFLIVLFHIRLMAYGLYRLRSEYFHLGVVIACIAISAILPFKVDFGISSAILAFPFFYCGEYIKKNSFVDKYLELPSFVRLLTFSLLIILCLLFRRLDLSMDLGNAVYNGNIVFSYLFVFMFIFMVMSFCILLNDIGSFLVRTISASCIVIMGFHMTVVQILWAYANKFPDSVSCLFHSPVNSITCFFISLLIAMFLKRYAPFLIGNRK